MTHSDVRFDFNGVMSTVIDSEGIKSEEIQALQPQIDKIHKAFHAMKEMGHLPFMHLPYEEEKVQEIEALSKKYLQKFENLVVLGIGGSALGAKAILTALKGPYQPFLNFQNSSPSAKVFVCDDIDPDSFQLLLQSLDLKKTLFNVISKSGNTIETMSQWMIVKKRLEEFCGASWKEHVILTTDPEKGLLREMVNQESFASLAIASGVGGRYSLLSPVGLFPAAMGGIHLNDLLAGAKRADARINQSNIWMNPAYMLAAIQYLLFQKKKNIVVMMPYSQMLFPFSEWYSQLWAESIGKRFSLKGEEVHTGSTPVAACGPRDQHSQLQLYMEGPADKFILFLMLENYETLLTIPTHANFPQDMGYLSGQTLGKVVQMEALATETSLQQQKRPTAKFLIPHRNAYALGQLFYILEVATAFAGELFNVNPFDQPGVELGKKFAAGLLGKPGFEKYKFEVLEKNKDPNYVI